MYDVNIEFTRMTSKGQVVIPAELRRKLRMKAGTAIAVEESGGQIILQPITDDYIDSLRGMLGDTSRMIEGLRRDHHREDK